MVSKLCDEKLTQQSLSGPLFIMPFGRHLKNVCFTIITPTDRHMDASTHQMTISCRTYLQNFSFTVITPTDRHMDASTHQMTISCRTYTYRTLVLQ